MRINVLKKLKPLRYNHDLYWFILVYIGLYGLVFVYIGLYWFVLGVQSSMLDA
jgi:hypothetical protein